jgi:hypothetical protein
MSCAHLRQVHALSGTKAIEKLQLPLFCHSRQRIFETPRLRCEAFDLRYENDMKKGSAFIAVLSWMEHSNRSDETS